VSRSLRSGTVALAAALLVGAWPASGELAKWNQERVAKLAGELAESTKDLESPVRQDPNQTYGSGQAQDYHRLRDELRLIRKETRHLARRLADGASREETDPVWQRVGVLARNAAEIAKRMHLPEPVLDSIAQTADLWRRLRPYYDPDWDSRPEGSPAEG
jgi:hypothetical protein